MYPPQPPPQWNNYTSPAPPATQQGTVPTPAAFFPQQTIGPRFPSERPGTQSRQALSNMLRQRHTSTQFVPASGANPSGSNPGVVPSAPPSGGGGGAMANNPRVTPGAASSNQQQFSNISMVDKQRQQFMRQQIRQQHTGGNVFGQQGPQQTQPQQQQQVQMAPGGFSNMHTPMNQNFNMFQSGTPGMQQLVNPQQQQVQSQPTQQQPQQQGMMGQHFPQGSNKFNLCYFILYKISSISGSGNFPMQQTQPQGNMILMQQQHQQPQGRGMSAPPMRPPFMQSTGMQMNSAQPNQFVRGAMPNTAQQQAVRLQQQQMVAIQQQQQMQHNMGQQQHNQHYHQPF